MVAATPKSKANVGNPKKSTFNWIGTDRSGKKVRGTLESVGSSYVKAELRKQGINATKISKKSKPITIGSGKPIKPMDIAIFSRQLATMTRAGIPLIQAFGIVSESIENPNVKKLILEIKRDVESGNPFATALEKHPQHFDELFCNLIASGEQSGSLELMLERIATYKEKTELLKQKIKKAMRYPIAVLAISMIVLMIMLVKVVPTFQTMFENFNAPLPGFTQMVVDASEWLQANIFLVIFSIAAIVVGYREGIKRSEKFSDFIDRVKLKMPIVGNIFLKSTIARFARTLSTTFSAGVPLVEGLESVAGAAGNAVYRDAINKIRVSVSSGQQLGAAMRDSGLFPPMTLQMISIGEESGALDDMLAKVADYYESEVDEEVDSLTALIEPFIMVFIGVVIGGIIVAMYLPIFSMAKAVT